MDIFGNKKTHPSIRVNLYADESQSRICPYSWEEWHYTSIIIENVDNPLLEDIIQERFCNDCNKDSPYYQKNNRIVHWSKLADADTKNICERWINYIINPNKSWDKFYWYILWINNSKLNDCDFSSDDKFNSKYNRFFRSAVLYALKSFFTDSEIVVENIFHEEGQQQDNVYFPWHIFNVLWNEKDISFTWKEIIFLPKDHKKDSKSNLIQLCDVFLGLSTSIIHGIDQSKRSKYREELSNKFLPLLKRMINNPYNKNSRYKYLNRIAIGFFPKEKTDSDDMRRFLNNFYTKRKLFYEEQKIEKESWRKQQSLFS